jgi:hypothetical protein
MNRRVDISIPQIKPYPPGRLLPALHTQRKRFVEYALIIGSPIIRHNDPFVLRHRPKGI